MNCLPKRTVLLLASALLLLPSSGIASQEIRGLVSELGSLAPVEEAVVTLFRVTEGTAGLIPVASGLSKPDGAFALTGNGTGTYRVQATHFDLSSLFSSMMALDYLGVEDDVPLLIPARPRIPAPGHPEVARPVLVLHDVELNLGAAARVVPSGEPVVPQPLLMEAAARALGGLQGQLLDAESGRPIPRAPVRLGDGRQQRITDEEGRFAFHALQPGHYLVEVAPLGYTHRSDEVEVSGGRDVLLQLRVATEGGGTGGDRRGGGGGR